jgi:hypothetical protein
MTASCKRLLSELCRKIATVLRDPLLEIFDVLAQLSKLALLENDCDQRCKDKDNIGMHRGAFQYSGVFARKESGSPRGLRWMNRSHSTKL